MTGHDHGRDAFVQGDLFELGPNAALVVQAKRFGPPAQGRSPLLALVVKEWLDRESTEVLVMSSDCDLARSLLVLDTHAWGSLLTVDEREDLRSSAPVSPKHVELRLVLRGKFPTSGESAYAVV